MGYGGLSGGRGPFVGAVGAPPLCLTASPPQGGEKIGAGGSSPHGSEMSRCVRNFSPPSGGRCRAATEGGRAGVGGWWARSSALWAHPPSALRHLPPKGGRKLGPAAAPPTAVRCRAAFGIFLPQRGEMSQRDRGGAGGRRWSGGRVCRRCARTPPLPKGISPPRGGEIGAGGSSPQGGKLGLGIFSPLREEMARSDRGGGRA